MKNYLPKILITGGTGQLGCALLHHPRAREFRITSCSHKIMDIMSTASIDHAITTFSPDIIINTAAYTFVDKAENEMELCMRVNYEGVKNLALACTKHQIPLLHISTDYVFNGMKASPYLESDTVNPINAYGKSKWNGEQAIREQCKQHIILRVSGIFSEYGHNFLKTMLHLAQEKKELHIVADQITCPTYASNIANVIYTIAQQLSSWGTYHYCDIQPVSWHQFASAIIHEAKQHHKLPIENVKAITSAEYPTLATRPLNSILDCSKLEREYGIQQAAWIDAVKHLIANMPWDSQ